MNTKEKEAITKLLAEYSENWDKGIIVSPAALIEMFRKYLNNED